MLLQVPRAKRATWKTLGLLLYRTGLLAVWTSFALPGVILNSPIFVIASIISRKKAKGTVVVSQCCNCSLSDMLCSGSGGFQCKSSGQGCPGDLEDPRFSRFRSYSVHFLLHFSWVRHCSIWTHIQVSFVGSLRDNGCSPNLRIFCSQVRGSRLRCVQVSYTHINELLEPRL
jgi:hypothetical protein